MVVLRLRDFTKAAAGTQADEQANAAQSVWDAGYAAGLAAAHHDTALALAQADHDRQQRLLALVCDAEATKGCEQAKATAQAAALLTVVAQVLLPKLAQDSLTDVLAGAFSEALNQTPTPDIILCIHPDDQHTAEGLLTSPDLRSVQLSIDAKHPSGTVDLQIGNSIDRIDTKGLCDALLTRLSDAISLQQKVCADG